VVDQLQEVFVDDWYFAANEDVTTAEYFGRWHQRRVFDRMTTLLRRVEAPSGDEAAVADSLPPGLAYDPPRSAPEEPASCAVVASGPHTEQNSIHDAFFTAITQAVHRVYIMTPYFIPDVSIMTALRTAVYRGVDVRVLLPMKIDVPLARLAARSYYRILLRAGVRIYEYAPCILHGKTIVIDDDLAVVGSANMDIRSFKLNFELSCFLRSRALARDLTDLFLKDLELSREITLPEMENRSRGAKLLEAAAHLISPLI
jgi:phosphatidylserine/phosphatidylglycerophosphate/cardiolipin synthase-like enzyme